MIRSLLLANLMVAVSGMNIASLQMDTVEVMRDTVDNKLLNAEIAEIHQLPAHQPAPAPALAPATAPAPAPAAVSALNTTTRKATTYQTPPPTTTITTTTTTITVFYPLGSPAPPAKSALNHTVMVNRTTTSHRTTTTLVATTTTSTRPLAPYATTTTVAPINITVVPINMQNTTQAQSLASEDCQLSFWADWGLCTSHHNKGIRSKFQYRTRQVTIPQKGNGADCGPLQETRACKTIEWFVSVLNR